MLFRNLLCIGILWIPDRNRHKKQTYVWSIFYPSFTPLEKKLFDVRKIASASFFITVMVIPLSSPKEMWPGGRKLALICSYVAEDQIYKSIPINHPAVNRLRKASTNLLIFEMNEAMYQIIASILRQNYQNCLILGQKNLPHFFTRFARFCQKSIKK